MKIVYTVMPIEGIVEAAHPPVATRIAKEKLKAIIEEHFMCNALVNSYAIADDREFPFPFDAPNPLKMSGFFGENPDYNKIARELTELFEQPKREYADFQAKLSADLEKATDEEIVAMIERFHYTPDGTKARHNEAVTNIRNLWGSHFGADDALRQDIEAQGYNKTRKDLIDALAILDDCHVYGLLRNLQEAEVLLKSGKKDKAKEMVVRHYSNWRRKNLAPLYNACGDAKFYGGGFWIARMVAPTGENTESWKNQSRFTKVEEALDSWKMPFQVIQL
ncbi:MAG TPA: hypothetical protein VJA18_02170 [Candidatus Nanoarchaeia archaeon]|nr:hypothetical protein [Candidatus Nanoarchaeia archaeon]